MQHIKKRLNKNSGIHDVNRAFYIGLAGSLLVLISSLIFLIGIPESGEDSFLFIRLFLISFLSGIIMLFSLFAYLLSKDPKKRQIGGILLLAFSPFGIWAFFIFFILSPLIFSLFLMGPILGIVSGILILKEVK